MIKATSTPDNSLDSYIFLIKVLFLLDAFSLCRLRALPMDRNLCDMVKGLMMSLIIIRIVPTDLEIVVGCC